MREQELYMRLCVRLAWTKREERTRRRRAAEMLDRLLMSSVMRSIEWGPVVDQAIPPVGCRSRLDRRRDAWEVK